MGRRTWAFVGVCCLSFAVCAEDYLSPSAVVADKDGQKLWIAESTAEQVALFDIATGKVEKTLSLPQNPTGLALTSDGAL
ncbi:MAG: hypothetical protein FJ278_23205, partial [Planctomycetes bacterium]|nr:hypothetical protein [Planctomycetota bacterium]